MITVNKLRGVDKIRATMEASDMNMRGTNTLDLELLAGAYPSPSTSSPNFAFRW
jgi:hypothetical protein